MHTAAFQWVNPKETDYWDDLSIVGRITLIHILRRIRGYGLDSSGLLNGQVVSSCEYRNRSSGSTKCRETECTNYSTNTLLHGVNNIFIITTANKC